MLSKEPTRRDRARVFFFLLPNFMTSKLLYNNNMTNNFDDGKFGFTAHWEKLKRFSDLLHSARGATRTAMETKLSNHRCRDTEGCDHLT